ncbi:MAG: hypothetical protein AAF170_04070 [Bacteroidota bacterium]
MLPLVIAISVAISLYALVAATDRRRHDARRKAHKAHRDRRRSLHADGASGGLHASWGEAKSRVSRNRKNVGSTKGLTMRW